MKLIDLHCDTLLRVLEEEYQNLPSLFRANPWHVDLQKLKKADSLVQVFAIFIPPARELVNEKNDKITDQFKFFLNQYELFCQEIELNKKALSHAVRYSEIKDNQKKGLISALLSIEEGNILENRIDRLDDFYQMGIRLITLLWNHENCLGFPHSSQKDSMEKGLKPFGKKAICRMEELGIIIDVSHLSDGGFRDVVEITQKPFVASHSNCRSITDNSRNLTDPMIRTLADRGGVMGLNFFPEFLSDKPDPVSRVSHMVDHINHMKKIGGIDVIALGSDFDGIEGELEVSDIGQIGKLYRALEKSGYSSTDREKIWSKNALRVFQSILK